MINQSIQNYNEYFNKIANANMFGDMVFKLKKQTGHGHDDMPTRLLKERISIIIHPIT